MEKTPAFGYARTSIEEENIENQIYVIQHYAEKHGYNILLIAKDIGVSGAQRAFDRPGFKTIIEAVKTTGIKTIIVYDLTRLTRDMSDLSDIIRFVIENKIKLILVRNEELNDMFDNLVGKSPMQEAMAKAMLSFAGIIAEMERATIRQRTIDGLMRAKAQGKRLGRPPKKVDCEEIKSLMKKYGLSARKIWSLKYKADMHYQTFLRRLKNDCGIDV